MGQRWFVYMVECADGTLYTGITTDLVRRLNEHNNSPRGAKYTRSRRPVMLRLTVPCENRSVASRREAHFKKLSRDQKWEMIELLQDELVSDM
jgi:putative endonuclease